MKQITATPDEPVTVYYCKADIATGLTIRILHQGQVHKSSGIRIENASAIMSHDNSTGQPKKSGARCVLIIQKGTVTI